jgi:uncharacterized damage-inducible protein DinB
MERINMSQQMVGELQQESATTRRVLERVPPEKLEWRPHRTSMTLGQLAMHVASIPERISDLARRDGFDASQANFEPPQPKDKKEILDAFEQSVVSAQSYLSGLTAEAASQSWKLTSKGREVFTIPRAAVLRTVMFNHWYHHRGQLSVYLRMLEVPIPVIYGRSADENPFA